MALPAQIVALLLSEHAREPFAGPVLTYGKQRTNFSYAGALWMFESLGLQPHPAGMADPPAANEQIDFARLAGLMGLGEPYTLDATDLNAPVQAELRGLFGLIVDAGALEHVFDIRQGMMNTADLLRPGGRAVHVAPVNNHVNRGYVQLSPTFFHDYYVANGFADVRGTMIVQPRAGSDAQRWNFFPYEHAVMGGVNSMFCSGETQLGVFYSARKTAESTSAGVPLQSYFARLNEGKAALPYQFIVSYDPAQPHVRQFTDPEPGAGAVAVFSPIFTLQYGTEG
jgi:hypothetical protein